MCGCPISRRKYVNVYVTNIQNPSHTGLFKISLHVSKCLRNQKLYWIWISLHGFTVTVHFCFLIHVLLSDPAWGKQGAVLLIFSSHFQNSSVLEESRICLSFLQVIQLHTWIRNRREQTNNNILSGTLKLEHSWRIEARRFRVQAGWATPSGSFCSQQIIIHVVASLHLFDANLEFYHLNQISFGQIRMGKGGGWLAEAVEDMFWFSSGCWCSACDLKPL